MWGKFHCEGKSYLLKTLFGVSFNERANVSFFSSVLSVHKFHCEGESFLLFLLLPIEICEVSFIVKMNFLLFLVLSVDVCGVSYIVKVKY